MFEELKCRVLETVALHISLPFLYFSTVALFATSLSAKFSSIFMFLSLVTLIELRVRCISQCLLEKRKWLDRYKYVERDLLGNFGS